ncbi:carboxymuconolactone decarboxylase family protein [Chitinophaga oryzae]|uniref:Carboxymuconolactone decarboxylase family protein n=1 Tax=Chitinophaga oryzae TaxID=2725414 RepID=A0AAE6ZE61_9BACT|nr:carboxymuconolactone decarboxylase family protein [Chitinophaga oryzae]QJB31297.1 carboxymuconolactone decarboxylase family protein [Chitinophaga oryzae]QJB37783.1 carboxymuconolactone decarboxylase family protein [Chitinophaga oryzae]
MEARISFEDVNKGFMDGLFKTGAYLRQGVDAKLHELINTRMSQINGCAYCLDMHYKDAVHHGEDPQRLYSLPAWRECPYYTEAERAALAFAEALNANHMNEKIYNDLAQHFSKSQIADIALSVAMIGTWNKLNIAFHTVPGGYTVGQHG